MNQTRPGSRNSQSSRPPTLNINGAINTVSLQAIVRYDDTINAQSAIQLFQQIERHHKTQHTSDKIKRIVAHRFTHGIPIFNDQLSHIVSGHTIVQRPLTILGQTNIDTCAYGCYEEDKSNWEALTCVELHT